MCAEYRAIRYDVHYYGFDVCVDASHLVILGPPPFIVRDGLIFDAISLFVVNHGFGDMNLREFLLKTLGPD